MKKNADMPDHHWNEEQADEGMIEVSCSCGYAPVDNPVMAVFVKALKERHVFMIMGVEE